MITCPECGRIVKVKHVWLNDAKEILRIDAICRRDGDVKALWTNYHEATSGKKPVSIERKEVKDDRLKEIETWLLI